MENDKNLWWMDIKFSFHRFDLVKYLGSPQVLNTMNNCGTRTKTKDPNSRYQRPNKSFLGIAITVEIEQTTSSPQWLNPKLTQRQKLFPHSSQGVKDFFFFSQLVIEAQFTEVGLNSLLSSITCIIVLHKARGLASNIINQLDTECLTKKDFSFFFLGGGGWLTSVIDSVQLTDEEHLVHALS